MDEARRFLRYLTPGVVFVVETVLFLWILFPSWTVSQLWELKTDSGLGLVATGALASGGFGFIFSVLHHIAHWAVVFERLSVIDHRRFLRNLVIRADPWLNLYDLSNSNPLDAEAVNQLTRQQAWIIVSALWHERTKTSKQIEGAHERMGAFYDLMHSLGTLRMSCLVAVFFSLAVGAEIGVFSYQVEAIVLFTVFLIVFLFFLCVHQTSYRITGRLTQQFVEQVLTDEIAGHWRPARAYVDLNR
jgi:hypothetical protein